MSTSLAIGHTISRLSGYRFSPASLFTQGEQGAWYDPADLTTLFQDSAGTTPVTAVEQPVGLMLDKSKGLVLGSELVTTYYPGGAYGNWNTLTLAGTTLTSLAGPNNGYSTKFNVVAGQTYRVVIPSTLVPSGGTWNIVVSWSTNGTSYSGQIVSRPISTTSFVFVPPATAVNCEVSIARTAASSVGATDTIGPFTGVSVKALPGNHAFQTTSAKRPVLSGRVNLLLSTTTLATQNVTTAATAYTLRFTGTGSITLSGTATGTFSAGTNSVTCTAGTLTLTVTGTVTDADLRVTNTGVNLPPYQRVNTSTDYDTGGFPLYLKFDGVDDAMTTNTVDFSAADKMTVWAGVRKLSDAATAVIAELSSSTANNGVFSACAPIGAGTGSYRFLTRGTVSTSDARVSFGYSAPITNVFTGIGDIAVDSQILRLNNTEVASDSADQGTGNFGNYPLFLGARDQTTLYFNGNIYSLIIRGAQSTTPQISATESWVNQRTAAY